MTHSAPRLIIVGIIGFFSCAWGQPAPDTLWTRSYGYGYMSGLAELPSGGYTMIGTSYSQHWWTPTAKLIQFNEQGDWWLFRGRERASVHDFAVYPDGSVLIAGADTMGTETVGTVTRLDTQGDTVWARYYPNNFGLWCIAAASNGELIAGSASAIGQNGYFHVVVSRLDSAGHWLAESGYFAENWYTWPRKILPVGDGGCVVLSDAQPDSGGLQEVLFFKLALSGTIEWTFSYADTAEITPESVIPLAAGGWAISATGSSGPNGSHDFLLLRLSEQGTLLDQHWYGTEHEDNARGLVQLLDGGFLLGGETKTGGYHSEMMLVRVDSTCAVRWSRIYPGNEADMTDVSATHVLPMPDGGFLIGGERGLFDFWGARQLCLYRIAPEGSAADIREGLVPEKFLLSIYPNPFNSSTRLSYDLPRNEQINLAVYDLTGRLVRTLEDRIIPQGRHTLIFDGSALPSGMYFVRLRAKEFSQTQKLLLLK